MSAFRQMEHSSYGATRFGSTPAGTPCASCPSKLGTATSCVQHKTKNQSHGKHIDRSFYGAASSCNWFSRSSKDFTFSCRTPPEQMARSGFSRLMMASRLRTTQFVPRLVYFPNSALASLCTRKYRRCSASDSSTALPGQINQQHLARHSEQLKGLSPQLSNKLHPA